MKPVYLIDSSIYIFRYYFSGLPSHLSQSGREVSTVLRFTSWLIDFMRREQARSLACFFDESLGSCFRNDIDKNYKSSRALPDESLAYELLACKKIAGLLGIPCFTSSRYEADDLIASASNMVSDLGDEPIIVTRDKDLGQLLRPEGGLFWDYGHQKKYDYDRFSEQFGIQPKHIADYLAIAGDPSDDIVGVRGVGKKTVAKLFEFYDGWQELKDNLDSVASLKIRGARSLSLKLKENRCLIEKNLKLTMLDRNSLNDIKSINANISFDVFKNNQFYVDQSDVHFESLRVLLEEFNAAQSLRNKVTELM